MGWPKSTPPKPIKIYIIEEQSCYWQIKMAPKFDISSEKGLNAFNGFISSKSYVDGWTFSTTDIGLFSKFSICPSSINYPHAYRWYKHIAAIQEMNHLAHSTTFFKTESSQTVCSEKNNGDEDEDFDVFGDDNDEGDEEPKESRTDMLARLKKEAEERTLRKEAKQRTLVSIDIKPWDTEQDLMKLWKKVTTEVKHDGLKWGEGCTLVDVAFGIKKICTTFTMGMNNSSDDVVEAIQGMEDDVQSVEITSMNVL